MSVLYLLNIRNISIADIKTDSKCNTDTRLSCTYLLEIQYYFVMGCWTRIRFILLISNKLLLSNKYAGYLSIVQMKFRLISGNCGYKYNYTSYRIIRCVIIYFEDLWDIRRRNDLSLSTGRKVVFIYVFLLLHDNVCQRRVGHSYKTSQDSNRYCTLYSLTTILI